MFRQAEVRPFDVAAMGTQDYDITRYQPILFAVESIERLHHELGTFFAGYDDEEFERLTALAPAS